ncbi:MAG: undecaprenyldiphospho-muramoylpentapeptide beta-N-acetylglucosaminyltransferase [Candidatus Obscuribacterales bacterium]|nr:undecaprenyldiphospho-muramoylpentapeptide beta-N-acetylglucosaminyltransferase [Candidatus Obscuribacterales bacterium]
MSGHRIVLSGGGTGGHVYPALSVFEVLEKDPQVEAILYIGAHGHIEERIAKQRGIEFRGLDVSGMPRKRLPALLKWLLQMLKAEAAARTVLTEFRPTVVLGTGGYASAPALGAAKRMGVPYVIHEPDAHPGLANKFFASGASLISLGMEGAKGIKSGRGESVVNGNPIGQGFLKTIGKDEACRILGIRNDLKTLVVTGGSQGAKAINDALISVLQRLLNMQPLIQVVHQSGDKNIDEVKAALAPSLLNESRYCVRPYFDDMSVVYAACDLVVSRAGAMTIAELSCTGTPSIFVPFPFAAQNHQMHNARFLESKGAAIVIPQSELTPERLGDVVQELISTDARLESMRRNIQALGKPTASRDLAEQLKMLSDRYQARNAR